MNYHDDMIILFVGIYVLPSHFFPSAFPPFFLSFFLSFSSGGTISFTQAFYSPQPYVDVPTLLLYRLHFYFVLWCTVW